MKYLCADWGFRKVGLAFSEGVIATPLTTLMIFNLEDGISKVMEIVKKEEIDVLVMGKPEGGMGKAVEKAAKLFIQKGVKVQLVDETLSTQEAKRTMLEIGVKRKARKEDDALSAAIILQRYLDDLNA